MPSPIYQYMTNLLVCPPIRRGSGIFMKFRCGNNMLLKTRFFDVAKFTILKQLSLISRCKLSFPIVGWKISSLPSFALKSPNRRFNGIEENDRKSAVIPDKNCPLNYHFSSPLGTCTFKTMMLHQRPLRPVYNILAVTNSTVLTAENIL